jgi:hypothetical protein
MGCFYQKFISDEKFRVAVLFLSLCNVNLSTLKKYVIEKTLTVKDVQSSLGIERARHALLDVRYRWDKTYESPMLGKFSHVEPSKLVFDVDSNYIKGGVERELRILLEYYKEVNEIQPDLWEFLTKLPFPR